MDLAQAIAGLQCHYCGPKLDCVACTGLAPAVRLFLEAYGADVRHRCATKCDPGPLTDVERADLSRRPRELPWARD